MAHSAKFTVMSYSLTRILWHTNLINACGLRYDKCRVAKATDAGKMGRIGTDLQRSLRLGHGA